MSVSEDAAARFWNKTVRQDAHRWTQKMERLRAEEEKPADPPLYLTHEQRTKHALVQTYVTNLEHHEARVDREKALVDVRMKLKSIVVQQ